MSNSTEIGRTIADLRKAAGFTQKELADVLCVTDKAVSKWERGIACPDISLLPKLSALLDCDIEPILSGISVNPAHFWTGVLVLEETVDVQTIIFDKPMVYYLISSFMLSGISRIHIACGDVQKKKIQETLKTLPDLGLTVSYSKTFDANECKDSFLFVIKGSCFLFGASLTRQFQGFMSASGNIQVCESNGNPLSIYFIKSKDSEAFEKKCFNRGIISIPLDSFENVNDASNFVKIFQCHSGQKIGDLEEISANRNFIQK